MSKNPFDITGKTVLITGASSGIGKATAIHLAKQQALVFVTGRNKEKLELAVSEIDHKTGEIGHIAGDLCDDAFINELAEKAPKLDGLVLCAGIVDLFPVKYLNSKKLDTTFKINYESAVLLLAALLKRKKLNKNASVVFISSISSSFPYKGGAAYTGSKAALEAFSKVFALENAAQGIRSNCIKAGLVETNILEETKSNMPEELMRKHEQSYPLGFGKTQDVSNAVQFLLSDASSWVTGTNIILDGGLTAGV